MNKCTCSILEGYCNRDRVYKMPRAIEECKKLDSIDEENNEIISDDIKKQNIPGILEQIVNIAESTTDHIISGMRNVDNETYKERLDICKNCPFFIASEFRCSKCGCYMKIKAKWETSICPDNPPRW